MWAGEPGRPGKLETPLWDAFQKARAENPQLGKRQFAAQQIPPEKRTKHNIAAVRSQLNREERKAREFAQSEAVRELE